MSFPFGGVSNIKSEHEIDSEEIDRDNRECLSSDIQADRSNHRVSRDITIAQFSRRFSIALRLIK
jgi:hypothetical protein